MTAGKTAYTINYIIRYVSNQEFIIKIWIKYGNGAILQKFEK